MKNLLLAFAFPFLVVWSIWILTGFNFMPSEIFKANLFKSLCVIYYFNLLMIFPVFKLK